MVETWELFVNFTDEAIRKEFDRRELTLNDPFSHLSNAQILKEAENRGIERENTVTGEDIAEIRKAYAARDDQHFNVLMDRMLVDINA